MTSLKVSRDQVLSFRRRVGGLDERLPKGRRSLRQAAWAGLQDSMPRAALLSIHARVDGAVPRIWQRPPLVQVWGPRFSAYVVAQQDVATFTVARMPEEGPRRRRAVETADRLQAVLGGESVTYSDAGKALGVSPNSLRYAALTGRVLIYWFGARRPTIRMVPPPDIESQKARKEMARRFLCVFGPSTAPSFAGWAGIRVADAAVTFESLNLISVRTPLGEAWLLAADEESLRSPAQEPAPARLLPSGDAYYLLQGADRELLVPDAARRDMLWTSRVWPGAILKSGEIVGTWRRSTRLSRQRARGAATIRLTSWRRLNRVDRDLIAAEAESLPLPDVDDGITVVWDS